MGRKKKIVSLETNTSNLSTSPEAKIFENPIDDFQYYRGDKNIPKSEAQFEWTPKMVQELKKCKEDIIYFAENYFYIVNLDRGKEVIKLYTRQRQILRSLINNRFTILLSCRQFGKCLHKESLVKIRNKKTGVIEEIKVEELFKRDLTMIV